MTILFDIQVRISNHHAIAKIKPIGVTLMNLTYRKRNHLTTSICFSVNDQESEEQSDLYASRQSLNFSCAASCEFPPHYQISFCRWSQENMQPFFTLYVYIPEKALGVYLDAISKQQNGSCKNKENSNE